MKLPRSSRARVAFGAFLAGLVTIGVVSTSSGQTTAPAPVTITGSGAWGPAFEMTPWQDAMFGAAAPVDMKYTPHGSKLGREDFLAGSTDFVISGVPFSDAELAQLPHGKADIVDVPIQVSTLGFLVSLPYPNGFQAQTDIPGCDPDDPPATGCTVRTPYTGALKIPNENLGAMMFNYPGTCTWPAPPSANPHLPLNSWTCSPLTEAWGLGSWGVGSGKQWVSLTATAGPVPVLRSDPDETSYYLQQYVKQVAPTSVWNPLVAEGASSSPRIDWEPITEHFPRLTRVASRDGAGQQVAQLGFPSQNPITGSFSNATGGIIANVPLSAVSTVTALNPNVALAELQNKAGEWVAPTSATINAAVDAVPPAVASAPESAMYAATHSVTGAYPLVWIDHMYVHATGLTAAKVEALASTIRYLVTDGQAVPATVHEGRLSTELAKQAVAGADELVTKACPTDGTASVVQSTDPGPNAPAGAGVKAIGTMKHCEATATTTTTVAAAVAAPSAASSAAPLGVASTPSETPLTPLSGPAATPVTSPPAATATAVGATSATKTKKPKPEAVTVVDLPLPEVGANGFDRLALGVLGAGAFLILRNPIRRLLRPGSP